MSLSELILQSEEVVSPPEMVPTMVVALTSSAKTLLQRSPADPRSRVLSIGMMFEETRALTIKVSAEVSPKVTSSSKV